MPSHNLTEDQWQRACIMFFEGQSRLGEIAAELDVPVHWLTGGDSLLGYAIRRDREAASGIEAATADETALAGSAEGESPVPEGQTPTSPSDHPGERA